MRSSRRSSDVIILSVRPQDWAAVDIAVPDKLVVSVMAGVASRNIGKRTQSRRLARTLPNAAAEVGCSYTPVFVDSPQTGDEEIVREIFETCGAVDVGGGRRPDRLFHGTFRVRAGVSGPLGRCHAQGRAECRHPGRYRPARRHADAGRCRAAARNRKPAALRSRQDLRRLWRHHRSGDPDDARKGL